MIIDLLQLNDFNGTLCLCSKKPNLEFSSLKNHSSVFVNGEHLFVYFCNGYGNFSNYLYNYFHFNEQMIECVKKYSILTDKFILVRGERLNEIKNNEYKIIPFCEFVYGSTVYGSNDENSDVDTFNVCLTNERFEQNLTNINDFQRLLDEQDIQAIEIFSKYGNNSLFMDIFKYELNKDKLRTSISTITSNSWVKGKKKLTVMGDYDLRAGLKSVFHSIRILDFGIQIATDGKIVKWDSYNYVLKDLYKLSESKKHHELWELINSKYRGLFLKLSTEFKKLCPKNVNESANKKMLIDLMKQYNIPQNDEFVEAILFNIR